VNVLYLTINPNRASTTVPTEGWFRCLRPRGLRPVLASREIGDFHDWATGQGLPAYHVPLPIPSKTNPLPFMKSLWQLRRIVYRHHIQLIHCNEQDCYLIGSYLARITGLPIVVSVHFTMGRGFCEWAFGGRRCPDRMFFVSRGNVEACRPGITGVVSPDRWKILHNGLDLDQFTPDEQRRSKFRTKYELNEKLAVGVACALRPRKQLEHFFQAISGIDENRVRVFVAGGPVEGDEQYARTLIANAQETLGSRLIVLGHLSELRELYNGLDVFVNTSQEEACSISIMESLACGCPVLGYPSKSVDGQILPDGGEIVPQDDIGQLTAALGRWLRDPVALLHRRARARSQAECRFDIRALAEQLWDEYEAVLSGREAASGSAVGSDLELTPCQS
jgi:L-malate glycosyltransferase